MQNVYRLKQVRRWGMVLLSGLLLVVTLMFGGVVLAQDLPPNSAGVAVQGEVLQTLQEEGSADFILVMAEQADLSAAYQMDWETRGWYVYNTLRETAERSQAPVIAALEAAGVRYQSFIAGNEIYVYDGSRTVLNRALWAGEIQEVRAPVEITLAAPQFRFVQPGPQPQSQIQSTAWGITDTGAPDFWAQFGLRGEDVRVASIDTGAQWDHPALLDAYACKDDPSSPVCWRDPAGKCTGGVPCDDHGHGTHTIGTMVGSDNPALPYRVGMAPGARWIACKGCTGTSCSGLHLAACADWLLAPGGSPLNRPQVVNNSWGGQGGNLWFISKVNAWRASGIFPVFAAGNSGSSCSTLNSPGDYPQSFSVAAYTEGRSIASFSSRGPLIINDQPYTKPDLTAPGDYILSSVPTNGWAYFRGTSMAAPHVAGAAALLYACALALRGDMTATFELLQQTADPPPTDSDICGTPEDGLSNYTYGYGYLNVLRAGQTICPIGQIQGTVSALSTGQPLPNSIVSFIWIGKPWHLTTDSAGFFQKTSLVAQTYQVIASADGYCSASQQATVESGSTVTVNLSLIECPNRLFLPAINR